MSDKSAEIARLNDIARRSVLSGISQGVRCRCVMTRGVAALPLHTRIQAQADIAAFDSFDADNDPYGEHDFAEVVVDKQRIWFKIDYFAPNSNCTVGAEDPADPLVERLLTILLPEEY